MSDLTWSQVLVPLCLLFSSAVALGTMKRRKRNRRIGLPAPTAESTRVWR